MELERSNKGYCWSRGN